MGFFCFFFSWKSPKTLKKVAAFSCIVFSHFNVALAHGIADNRACKYESHLSFILLCVNYWEGVWINNLIKMVKIYLFFQSQFSISSACLWELLRPWLQWNNGLFGDAESQEHYKQTNHLKRSHEELDKIWDFIIKFVCYSISLLLFLTLEQWLFRGVDAYLSNIFEQNVQCICKLTLS